MNAKHLLSSSALALIAPVFAQTVPAEQWVGPPIQIASSASRDAVVGAYIASVGTEAAAPQELRVGPTDPRAGALSAAEVAADLNLWIRSGMAEATARDDFDPNAAAYLSQVAMYENLRYGPAFVAEVRRIRGESLQVITSARLDDDAASH